MKNNKKMLLLIFSCILILSCQDNKKENKNNDAMNESTTEMNQRTDEDENNWSEDDRKSNEEMKTGPTVAEVVESSEEHSTLLSAMKEAGIIVKLEGPDEYTVFAPTNSAFEDLPKGTINDWMKPDNAEELEGVLSYHIIPGLVDSAKLKDLIKSNNNKYVLVTGNDGKLTASMNDAGNIILTDAAGKQATIVSVDMKASNGVVHSINRVLMRK